ncbi:preprotein translocase YajC subunit [Friedmanniella endophytica]|uniref:Preprotein translocase YajC subunit n=1 Tax=Microlunatus kandeliicorticis TaxID=1759536 RepID=A0A7W3P6N2_9ACTN|nr:preprotein translocase subunit YajC [Microlunatus kandeliicorticis]MBA8795149.1 preprotein translocase YajC subunit [Microlunatus kandeliicorticis]
MNSPYASIVLIAVLVLLMYFVVLRPQRKRQQAQQQTIRAIEPGARVMTTAGIYATVLHVGEKQMVLETSPGSEITVLKQAVAKVVPEGEEDPVVYEDETDDLPESEQGELGNPTTHWPPTSATGTATDENVWSAGTDASSQAAARDEVPPHRDEPSSALGDSSLTDDSRTKRD